MKSLRLLAPYFLVCIHLGLAGQNFQIGNISTTYYDPERNNRAIPTEVFYPSLQAGTNTPVAPGVFPVVVIGHGFLMVYSAYQYLWQALVPQGYIVALPKTEGSLSPNHLNFGLDLAFLVKHLKSESYNPSSPFYGKVAGNGAMMGHSMGGGASFLGAANNPNVEAVITFAAAETNPSAIAAAPGISAPSLVFAGQNDCVTPPAQHQIPLYNALPTGKKIMITINGGGHCYFADYNFFCSLGEGSCTPQPSITRQQQQQIVLSFLIPFLDFQLKGSYTSWQTFRNLLFESQQITFLDGWLNLPQPQVKPLQQGWNSLSYPIQPLDLTFLQHFQGITNKLILFTDYQSVSFNGSNIPPNFFLQPKKGYVLKLSDNHTLSYCGYPHANKTLTLEAGWNILPVLTDSYVTPWQLFQGNINKLQLIKEIAGTSVFWPEMQIESLNELLPGKAYWIKMYQPVVIEF